MGKVCMTSKRTNCAGNRSNALNKILLIFLSTFYHFFTKSCSLFFTTCTILMSWHVVCAKVVVYFIVLYFNLIGFGCGCKRDLEKEKGRTKRQRNSCTRGKRLILRKGFHLLLVNQPPLFSSCFSSFPPSFIYYVPLPLAQPPLCSNNTQRRKTREGERMDEVLAIREGARRIQDLADVVHDKYELHRGLMEVMRSVSRENFHKRYIHNLAYLIQGIEFSLKSIQENLINNARQRGKTLERSWFSRLISMFGIFFIIPSLSFFMCTSALFKLRYFFLFHFYCTFYVLLLWICYKHFDFIKITMKLIIMSSRIWLSKREVC